MPSAEVPRRRVRGFQHERELVRKFWKAGFAAVRGPASGAKVKVAVQPDVVAIKDGLVLVAEVKTMSRRSTLYVRREQVERLKEFAKRAGGRAYLAVKVIGEGSWRFVPVDTLPTTKSGNFRIDGEVLAKYAVRFEDLVRAFDTRSRRLDEYLRS